MDEEVIKEVLEEIVNYTEAANLSNIDENSLDSFQNARGDQSDEIIDLDDDSEVQIESESSEVVEMSMAANNTENIRIVESTNAIEEVVLDDEDDDDDDIIITKAATEEEKSKLRVDRIDKLLSWFIRLKPELIENCEIFRADYLTSSIMPSIVIEMESSIKYLECYKKCEDLDKVVEEFDLPSVHHALMGICVATLEKNNEDNIDFGPLCYDRLDLWAYREIRRFLDFADTGVEEGTTHGPLELMKLIYAPPSFVFLGLTLHWLNESSIPVNLEFMEIETYTCTLKELEEFENLVVKTSKQYWQKNQEIHEENGKITGILDEAFHDLEATEKAIREDMDRVLQVKNELLSCKMDDIRDEISKIEPPETLDLLSNEEREKVQQLIDSMDATKEMIDKKNSEIAEIRESAKTLHEALVLWPGDYCLARADANDNQYLQLAIVENQPSSVCYRLKFVRSSVSETVNIKDIAFIKFGMMDALVINTCYVGLRVACLCKESAKSEVYRWYSGTIGGRSASHGDEFLVFLDRGDDIYLNAPYSAISKESIAIYELPTDTNNVEVVKKRISLLKMVPMISQSFNENAQLDRLKVHEQLRDRIRAHFLEKFMEKYPEWPLLRLAIGKVLQIYYPSLDRRHKNMVTVVHTDRGFCIVRHQQSISSIGYGCIDYPCLQEGHSHTDESIYRGSYRIPEVYQFNGKGTENNNISKRSMDKVLRQFDNAEPRKRMPQVERLDYEAINMLDTANYSENKKTKKMSNSEIADRRKKQTMILKRRNETPELKALKDLKFHEKCGPECLQNMDSDPYNSRFYECSPLHIPLLCGWRRYKFTLRVFKRRTTTRRTILYYAPCGKPLTTLREIGEYLTETRSMVTIDCFSFDLDVDTEIFIYVDPKYIKTADYTNGLEGIPIPAVNTIDNEDPPQIEYTKRRFQYDATVDIHSIHRDFCSGCTCQGNCTDSPSCECQKLTMDSYNRLPKMLQYPNKKFQGLYDYRLLSAKVSSGIYECNDQCSCRKTCHNRVVQNNIKYPMQLFKTAQSGWGVRALTDIPKGAFLCNYVGALLTNDLADQLQNEDQYFADLDLKDVVEKEKMMVDNEGDHGFEDDEDYEDFEEEEEGESENVADDGLGNSDEGASMSSEDANLRRSNRQTAKKQREKSKKKMEKMKERNEEDALNRAFKWDDYFQDMALFVVDAKARGNIGRFLNHSCDPNVHVQHVLYDTHDLRLPWVAFFTVKPVRAGEELCWDYNYTFTRDDDEKIQCNCGSDICRGRLLTVSLRKFGEASKYEKKSAMEHVLIRPDTYIGGIGMRENAEIWNFDRKIRKMHRTVGNYPPGLLKIFDEILVNSADNKIRDRNMDRLEVTVDRETNRISVWNNGRGLPVEIHPKEGVYVPTLVFGNLFTSSNYDDNEIKTVGGRNGYGAKLCNIFSKEFIVETVDKSRNLKFRQRWFENMQKFDEPIIEVVNDTNLKDYTKVKFHFLKKKYT
ncbi:unnamed protein product [Caenorhabditis angaria]|uniref:DNA topoisomerase (ATP-hydrolyzing) n=1 Tax=Caenorhabditis angaria TaxID=860376 RepID=A0A9P1MZQ9_9PELO|nr:unnamed protein product [Caenorhabditis angaria]